MPPLHEIRADFDEKTIVVYQAFRPEIARGAVKHQRFVPPFSLERMTWVKPSFLWMMERSGWGDKANQECTLAVRITRAGWEEALSNSALSSGDTTGAPVVVQWDPERDVRGARLPHRSIQVGIGSGIVARYVNDWTVEIRDLTELVSRMREMRKHGEFARIDAERPGEQRYPTPEAIALRLGMA